jgi:hypothetical protein
VESYIGYFIAGFLFLVGMRVNANPLLTGMASVLIIPVVAPFLLWFDGRPDTADITGVSLGLILGIFVKYDLYKVVFKWLGRTYSAQVHKGKTAYQEKQDEKKSAQSHAARLERQSQENERLKIQLEIEREKTKQAETRKQEKKDVLEKQRPAKEEKLSAILNKLDEI